MPSMYNHVWFFFTEVIEVYDLKSLLVTIEKG